MEQLTAFEDYIRALERDEATKKRDHEIRQGRICRQAFIEFLKSLFDSREATHKTEWPTLVKDRLLTEPAYINLVHFTTTAEQPCSQARDLFEELCRDEKDCLKKYKDAFKTLVKQKNIRFPPTISFQDFKKEMSAYDQTPHDDYVQHLLYEYYIYKVNQKIADKERKAVKEICNFLLDNECLEIVKDLASKEEQFTQLAEMIIKQYPAATEAQRTKAIEDAIVKAAKDSDSGSYYSQRSDKKGYHRERRSHHYKSSERHHHYRDASPKRRSRSRERASRYH